MKKLILMAIGICLMLRASAQIEDPVKWSYLAKKVSPTEAIIYLKATIDAGWHIYATDQAEGGPQKTGFTFHASKGYSLLGKVMQPKPLVKREAVFNMDVRYYESSVVFSQKIKLRVKQAVVKGSVEFMACTNKECMPPAEVSFSIPVK